MPYTGTHASLPAGFTRDNRLNDVFVKCQDAGLDSDFTIFGSDTHTHTSPSHAPIQDGHTHFEYSDGSAGTTTGNPAGLNPLAADGHSHDVGESNSETAINQGYSITVNSTSNDPPYRKVIWLRSDGTATGVPSNGLALIESDTFPSGWTRAEGNNYLKGAASLADGTGTGGSTTHLHTSPAHTHVQDAHIHTADSEVGDSSILGGSTASNAPSGDHFHALVYSSTTAINNSTTTTISTSTSEPNYKKINIIKNSSGGFDIQNDMILFWEGLNSNIPTDFQRFDDLNGYFFKGSNENNESNVSTGGNLTHAHTASDCHPTQQAHAHTASGGAAGVLRKGSGVAIFASTNHTHNWTVYDNTATNQPAAVTIDSISSGEALPRHVKLIAVKYAPVAPSMVNASFFARSKRAQASASYRSIQSKFARNLKSYSQNSSRKSTIKRELKK